jgi:hypothetical protein
MADSTFEFSPSARLQILNILPQKAGSLRESIQVKRLRDRINFSDEEKDQIGFNENTGGFNPNKLGELGDMEIELGENEREIIAGCIIQKEDEGEVPTNDGFVDLAMQLAGEIEEFRASLDNSEE